MNVSDIRREWEWRSDEEVLEAYANRYEDLTEVARGVVEEEMRRRGLEERIKEQSPETQKQEKEAPPEGGLVSFGEIPGEISAQGFLGILQSHGVRARLVDEHAAAFYRGSAIPRRLFVHGDDVEDARAILTETLRMAREYEEKPSCFDCDSPDVAEDELSLSEKISRMKAYRCRACGYRWAK